MRQNNQEKQIFLNTFIYSVMCHSKSALKGLVCKVTVSSSLLKSLHVCGSVNTLTEDTFDRRRPLREDNLRREMTFDRRRPLTKDNL